MSSPPAGRIVAAALALCVACGGTLGHSPAPGGATGNATSPVASDDGPSAEELIGAPPPPAPSPAAPFPAIGDHALSNGMRVRWIERRGLPLVELRLLIRSGSADDAAKPGVARLTSELLKAGGAGPYDPEQLVRRAESLGSSLRVDTSLDATTVSLSVMRNDIATALEILGHVATHPRLSLGEFAKLRDREIERVKSLAKTDGHWMANMVVHRKLFELPTGRHPYSRFDVQPDELKDVTLGDCRTWYQRHFTPENAQLVAVGDVEPGELERLAAEHFGKWRGAPPPRTSFATPAPGNRLRVFVVQRDDAAQSDVFLATLGPAPTSREWPALSTALQVLGGGVAGRLFLDVREQRGLAYRAYAAAHPLAHGPSVVELAAGTRTAKTAHTVQALLEHLERMASHPPSAAELSTAQRYLVDGFLMRMETVESLAGLTTQLSVFGLPDRFYDEYRDAVASIGAEAVTSMSARHLRMQQSVVVVAGDAAHVAEPLRHFGPVAVLDPDSQFAVKKTLSFDPTIGLEIAEGRPATSSTRKTAQP